MLKFSLRNCQVARRWKTEYVLARKVDGQLVEVKINVTDPVFYKKPRFTAEVKLPDDKVAVCTFDRPSKLVAPAQEGCVQFIRFEQKAGERWWGKIKKMDADSEAPSLSFEVSDAVDQVFFKTQSGKFGWNSKKIYKFDECVSFDNRFKGKKFATNLQHVGFVDNRSPETK